MTLFSQFQVVCGEILKPNTKPKSLIIYIEKFVSMVLSEFKIEEKATKQKSLVCMHILAKRTQLDIIMHS